MTILAPLPIQQFKDSNGNPLAGGLLYTYAAGTSTPQTTYQDVTTATPNTNPIVLNSRGEAQIWLTASLSYKFLLQDAAANLIWTVDQISSAAGATSVGIQSQTYTAVTTTGTSTAYAIVTSPIQVALAAGQRYRINLHTPNGATPTLSRDGLAAIGFKVYNAAGAKVAPAAAGLPTLFDAEYDGVDYVVLNPLPTAAATISGYTAKAWCVFNGTTVGTNAPLAGQNVTSVTRNAAGVYTVNFTASMPTANYAATVTPATPTVGNGGAKGAVSALAASNFQARVSYTASAGTDVYDDSSVVSIVVFSL